MFKDEKVIKEWADMVLTRESIISESQPANIMELGGFLNILNLWALSLEDDLDTKEVRDSIDWFRVDGTDERLYFLVKNEDFFENLFNDHIKRVTGFYELEELLKPAAESARKSRRI